MVYTTIHPPQCNLLTLLRHLLFRVVSAMRNQKSLWHLAGSSFARLTNNSPHDDDDDDKRQQVCMDYFDCCWCCMLRVTHTRHTGWAEVTLLVVSVKLSLRNVVAVLYLQFLDACQVSVSVRGTHFAPLALPHWCSSDSHTRRHVLVFGFFLLPLFDRLSFFLL